MSGDLEADYLLTTAELIVGRDPVCDVVINRNTVSKRHARFIRQANGSYQVIDNNSSSGVYVNGTKVTSHMLVQGDQLILGDVLIHYVEEADASENTMGFADFAAAKTQVKDKGKPGTETVDFGVGAFASDAPSAETMDMEQPAAPSGPPKRPAPPAPPPAGKHAAVPVHVEEEESEQSYVDIRMGASPFADRTKKQAARRDPYTNLRAEVHEKLVEAIRLRGVAAENLADAELWKKAYSTANQIIFEMQRAKQIPEGISPKRLLKDVLDEALGLGPINDYLSDPSIEEIMVNGPENIFVAKRGKTIKTKRRYIDDERLLTAINRIVAPLGRPLNQARPLVDARLADGSRVNAIIPPVSLVGPVLTIRKFPSKPLTPDDLVAKASMSPAIKEFLNMAVKHRQNIVVAGATAAGKTTLLNVISTFIPSDERIITIEDSAELQLQQPHVIGLEARPPGGEGGTAEVTIRDLVKNSLRMRPDRIVLGECRGGEALDMLQAMNTGHDGSLTTGHANSAKDMLSRLETMCLMAKGIELPLQAIREQISRAVHLIVHCERFPDGSRRIHEIVEVLGLEDGQYIVHDIYRFEYKLDAKGNLTGRFVPLGRIPQFIEKLKERGVDVPLEIFMPE
jgi:pilus assembly protein CpaF